MEVPRQCLRGIRRKTLGHFIKLNDAKITKLAQRSLRLPSVIVAHLLRRNNRTVIQYNCFQRNRYLPNKKSKYFNFGIRKKLNKIAVTQWSKRIVDYLRKKNNCINLSSSTIEEIVEIQTQDVQTKIKEQLTLLKSGKQKDTLVKKSEVRNSTQLSGDSFTELSFDIGSTEEHSDIVQNDISDNIDRSSFKENANDRDKCLTKKKDVNSNDNSYNILDILMSKVQKTTKTDVAEISSPYQSEKSSNSSPFNMNISDNIGKLLLCNESSRSSDEFLGFSEAEVYPRAHSSLIDDSVDTEKPSGAFTSKVLDKFLIDNALVKDTTETEVRQRFSDALVVNLSQIPKLTVPSLPEELKRSRTVAEKRLNLQKFKNPAINIIDDIQTISHELNKRKSTKRFNMNIVKHLRHSRSPMPRDSWKATSWLLTDIGKYFFQVYRFNGTEVKLVGSCGNHKTLYMPSISSKSLSKQTTIGCPSDCQQNEEMSNITPIKLQIPKQILPDTIRIKLSPIPKKKPKTRPVPLSKKLLQRNSDDALMCRPLEIYEMPDIQLEVFPQLHRPLDENIKQYLKLITPSESITKEWANFAVSTLIDVKKEEEKNDSNPISFTFPIPYKNDQNRIVVRKMLKREEQFVCPKNNNDLKFLESVDCHDPTSTECGNVLSDMINSVAIGLSEDSLINLDPDIIERYSNEPNVKIKDENPKKLKSVGAKVSELSEKSKKKNRLLIELRRLNATIIDAETLQEEKDEKCDEDACQLGCICQPNNHQDIKLSLRHCGLPNCMWDCVCPFPSYNSLNSNNMITTEEAINFRRQATARLAPLEKEFTSTVLITNNETLLINEKQFDRKRRCTKLPKRYNDFLDSDTVDALSSSPTKKIKPTPPPPPTPPKLKKCVPSKDKTIVFVNEETLKTIKHCEVNLTLLPNLKNVTPWCMVHCVYQCPCNCQETEGKPIIQMDEIIAITSQNPQPFRKAAYSFEKNPEEKKLVKIKSEDSTHIQANDGSVRLDSNKMDVDIIRHYVCSESICKRTMPIPIGPYRRKNQKRVGIERKKIKLAETDKTANLLKFRVDMCRRNKSKCKPENKDDSNSMEMESGHENTQLSLKRKKIDKSSKKSRKIKETATSSLLNSDENLPPKLENSKTKHNAPEKIPTNISKNISKNIPDNIPEKAAIGSVQKESLNDSLVILNDISSQNKKQTFQFTPPKYNQCLAGNGKRIHEKSIERLNSLVTNKIFEIISSQKSKNLMISGPVKNTIFIFPWNNFVESYHQQKSFVWEIKTQTSKFFVLTVKNAMPMIENVLSVVNVRAIELNNLPKLFKLLISSHKVKETMAISVLMQGFEKYWRILGVIEGPTTPISSQVFKPTPQSHPWLTGKINLLYHVLVKQETLIQNSSALKSMVWVEADDAKQKIHKLEDIENEQISLSHERQPNMFPKPNGLTMEDVLLHCYDDIKTNVKLRDVQKEDLFAQKLPKPEIADHRWLVLDLVADFSHMYLASTKEFMSLERIKKTLFMAAKQRKTVKLQIGIDSTPYGCYVTSTSTSKLFFGPLGLLQPPPIIVLFQLVEKKMIPREDYESIHKITRVRNTMAFWIVQRNQRLALPEEAWTKLPYMKLGTLSQSNTPTAIETNPITPGIRTITPEEINSKIALTVESEKNNLPCDKMETPPLAGRRRRRKTSHKVLHDSNSDPIFNSPIDELKTFVLSPPPPTPPSPPPLPPLKMHPFKVSKSSNVSLPELSPEIENGLKLVTTNTWGLNTIEYRPISSSVNELSTTVIDSDDEIILNKKIQRSLKNCNNNLNATTLTTSVTSNSVILAPSSGTYTCLINTNQVDPLNISTQDSFNDKMARSSKNILPPVNNDHVTTSVSSNNKSHFITFNPFTNNINRSKTINNVPSINVKESNTISTGQSQSQSLKRKNQTNDRFNANDEKAKVLRPILPALKRRPDFKVFNEQTSNSDTTENTNTSSSYSLKNINIQQTDVVVDVPVHIMNTCGIEPVTASILVKPKQSSSVYTTPKDTQTVNTKTMTSLQPSHCISNTNNLPKDTQLTITKPQAIVNSTPEIRQRLTKWNSNMSNADICVPKKPIHNNSLDAEKLNDKITAPQKCSTLQNVEKLNGNKNTMCSAVTSLDKLRCRIESVRPEQCHKLSPPSILRKDYDNKKGSVVTVNNDPLPQGNNGKAPINTTAIQNLIESKKSTLKLSEPDENTAAFNLESYGYFVPTYNKFPKCISKQIGNMFAIRIPNGGPGIIRLRGEDNVNKFLKNYVREHNPELNGMVDACNWKFEVCPKMFNQLRKFAIKKRLSKDLNKVNVKQTKVGNEVFSLVPAINPNEVILIDDDEE